jgi:hypothetical protein
MAGMAFTRARYSRASAVVVLLLTATSCGSGRVSTDAPSIPDAVDADAGANTTIGATCGIPADAGPNQFVYNVNAPECAGNMCMKPIVQPGATGPSNTTAFCTASCSQDSDCAGQNRDPGNPLDTRCARGFACGVLFVKGALCCQKFCICQDFLGPSGLMTPIACQGDAASSCNL